MKKHLPEKSFDRLILAYLCIDHVDTNYFVRELDVQMGYVMADMLSIYLFLRWQLTVASETDVSAQELIDDKKPLRMIDDRVRRGYPSDSSRQSKRNIALQMDEYFMEIGRSPVREHADA